MASPITVPASLRSLTALGPLTRLFAPRPAKGIRSIGWAVAITGWLGFTAAALYGLAQAYWQYFLHGPAILWKTLQYPLILSLSGLLVGLVGIYLVMRYQPFIVAVYQDGLALLKGRNLVFWRWSEITSLKHIITHQYLAWLFLGVRHLLEFKSAAGEKVHISDRLEKIETLTSILYRKTFTARYAVYASAYQNGRIARFGSLSVHAQNGLRYHRRHFPWQIIQQVDLENGWLVLKLSTSAGLKEQDIPAGNLPDLDVLLRLIVDQVTRQAR